ncbi:protein phosphatase 1F [Drosophila pseudoobscura]|uniref:Protein phosphatase 1F n=1 Tax=Drosophila pseudoobscura pseudoobscura TaxID=46245 RepID=A0A6I8UKN7_DROPS|nr:protein phosphatase 1F [Drosophila pseudoobscura]
MSADSIKEPAAPAVECAHMLEFKEFLAATAAKASATTEDLTRNCVTRTCNETYKVSVEERHAELVAAIWQQLNSRGCPAVFRLKLLHQATQLLEKEICYAKECEVSVEGPTQYDLLKLQKFVSNQMDKLLIKLTDNSEMERLKDYADEGVICQSPEHCMCGLAQTALHTSAAVKNKPRKMEDRHVCLDRFGAIYELRNRDCRFFGVFDGHSGSLSASYVRSQLPQLLADQLRQADQQTETQSSDFYRNAFEAAFLQADERFIQKRITSGTTCVCALINRDQLYIAWVGDSKALLVGKRTQLQLVKPHKPESPDERKRIEAAGGTVLHAQGQWRVNGILNVARSIGDYCLETVIAEPDFVDVHLNEAHDFLVLGTDGLWDHVPETFIIDTVYECLADPTTKLDDIPKLLIEAAKERDSQDNITAVIVLLKPRHQIER